MKLRHKITRLCERPPEPISERYQGEIDRSVRKAEKAWRNAQRQAERAVQREQTTPTPANRQLAEQARAAAEVAWLRFEELDRLLRQGPSGGANRSGRGSVRRVGKGGSGE